MNLNVSSIFLGALTTAFFLLLWRRLDAIEGDVKNGFLRMDQKFDLLQRDLREFYATQKQHDTRLDNLEHRK